MPADTVSVAVGAQTRYIISTSGRPTSLERYRRLLQEELQVDVAYIPISSGDSGPITADRFCMALRGMNCIGGAISKDIKAKVVPLLDEVDEFARRVGSVNTVLVRPGGKLYGCNTDAHGFREAIRKGIADSGCKVTQAAVYGYGGVSSVVVHVLRDMGITVLVTGRDAAKAQACARELGIDYLRPGDTRQCELLVNAAPVTDRPLELAEGLLPALGLGVRVVFDHEMPGHKLKEYCVEHGIHHIPGTAMYYPQMYRQWGMFLEGLAQQADIPRLIANADAPRPPFDGPATARCGSVPSSCLPVAAAAAAATAVGFAVGTFFARRCS
eukprot:TRINITY_DN11070_c0_g1_i1.p1 TRINITY_DN11070_c0_g1~~TRINITY_DN11070_c0_g1_i1.p1  ORF type:complete len:357 (+),score=83.02 TRINITY_DN11070_c0_g1_i1:91-1071(+)